MEYKEAVLLIREKLESHRKLLMEMGYADNWKELHFEEGDDPETVLINLDKLLSVNLFSNYVLEACPDSIVVTNKDGIVLRMNPAFQHTTGVDRKKALGVSVYELEKRGYFRPSVNGITLKEKKSVTIVQMGENKKETVVTGAPIFDPDGNMLGAVSNAKRLDEINKIVQYSNRDTGEKENRQEDNIPHHEMICQSSVMQDIKSMVDHVIDTDSNILLSGETGVGKGVMTKYIHNNGVRGKHKLIEINCGAIPETLLESELFGYDSGAFTGARAKGKKGLIEMADKGTILFDEINDLPLLLQVKLLHYIQNKKIVRVGGTKEIHVDARIIAASNKNLEKLVDEGLFRADLFYRLNVIPIKIPPLRERIDDIEAGARYFLKIYNQKYGKDVTLDDNILTGMKEYPWPGNMRELENYIERLVVSNKGKKKSRIMEMPDFHDDLPLLRQVTGNHGKSLKKLLEELEKEIIKQSFSKHQSSYKVAKELSISQTSAHRKIKKYVEE